MARALPDRIRPGLDLLLVGINPGLRSAALGHHFAGVNNRFWGLLHEAGLTRERLTFEDDVRLPELGIGVTNLAARATRSSSDLRPADFDRGILALEAAIARARPRWVAFVGVTAYREFARRRTCSAKGPGGGCGPKQERINGARVFVLPNPSGRNAHFPYREMLRHYRSLRRAMGRGSA